MADTLISGIFVTGIDHKFRSQILGYGIFVPKITGIRDIKTPGFPPPQWGLISTLSDFLFLLKYLFLTSWNLCRVICICNYCSPGTYMYHLHIFLKLLAGYHIL